MFHYLFIVLPLVFAPPEAFVRWASRSNYTVTISSASYDKVMEQCLMSGLELRYTFQFQICRKRSLWFDSCEKEARRIHLLKYDPISESYRVSLDTWKDSELPSVTTYSNLQDAVDPFISVKDIPLQSLTSSAIDGLTAKKKRAYLGVRVVSDCKGEYSKTIAQISSVLSLGLVSLEHFDTGWMDFSLAE